MTRYLDRDALRAALPMQATIDAIEEIFRAAAAGDATAPSRAHLEDPRGGRGCPAILLSMPASWRGRGFGVKVVTTIADNPAAGRPAVQGVAMLLDPETGAPLLIVDAGPLTTRRTGAIAGLATRYLAREGSRVLALIGCGALSSELVRGVRAERRIERVRLFDVATDRAQALAATLDVGTEVCASGDDAARGADVLVTATPSPVPVVSREAIPDGCHIVALGNFSPTGRELDGATVAACRRYVDTTADALVEAGEILLAADEGLIPSGPDAVVGDLIGLAAGEVPGRTDDEQITLCKGVGTALADLAALVTAAEASEARGLGLDLDAGRRA